MTQQRANELQAFAATIRLETVREVGVRGFGHIGGALSIADLLAVLYDGVMKYDPKRPDWPGRDKLVVSKGHAGPSVYATLALKGFFPMDWLKTLNQPGTHLPSHCDRKLTPGIDMTTGSLGQGTSSAIGLALAQQMDGSGARTFLITGDGELDEGQCWEAAMFAPQHDLPNLTWFVDHNGKQLDGTTDAILPLMDIGAKFEAFGWHVQTINGNDIIELSEAIEAAERETKKPSCIVMNTKKGAGIPAIEDIDLNHHIVLDGDLLENALAVAKDALEKVKGGLAQ